MRSNDVLPVLAVNDAVYLCVTHPVVMLEGHTIDPSVVESPNLANLIFRQNG